MSHLHLTAIGMQPASLPVRTLGAAARSLARARPSAAAALQASLFAATAMLFALQFIGIVAYDESPWKLLRMVAALARGPGALQPDDEFDFVTAATGLTLFYAIATLYGLALACILTDSPRRYASLIGTAFGLALYFANFHGFTALFPWFAEYRTVDTVLAHALFGLLLARAYCAFRGE
jgi:hypothetical protein